MSNRRNLSAEFLDHAAHWDRVVVKEIGFFKNRFLGEQVAACLCSEQYHLTIFPNYHTPFLLSRKLGKVATIIHDFRYRHYPRYTSWRKRRWLDLAFRNTFNRADRVIAISHRTCADAVRFFGEAARRRTCVVHNAVSWARLDDGNAGHPLMGTPYILSVAHNWAHKNLTTLLHAYHALRVNRSEVKLVLIGDTFTSYRPTHERNVTDLNTLAADLRLGDGIVFTGYVSDHEIARYYRHAAVFAFPSLFEGFGLPIVEAMGFGVTTVTSRLEPHVEVSLGKAQYVDEPRDPAQWCDILQRILNNPETYRPSDQVVREIRATYAPDRIAQQILESVTSCDGDLGGSDPV